jgi:hypothetical protein
MHTITIVFTYCQIFIFLHTAYQAWQPASSIYSSVRTIYHIVISTIIFIYSSWVVGLDTGAPYSDYITLIYPRCRQ